MSGAQPDLGPIIHDWFARLNATARSPTPSDTQALFVPDSHWRDAVAFAWELKTVSGSQAIAAALSHALARFEAKDFAVDHSRLPARIMERAGVACIEVALRFETCVGPCSGLVRFRVDQPRAAWTLHTALHAIRGHEEERLRQARDDAVFERNFHGLNWLDRRSLHQRFTDREPTVLIVGAGHAGLSVAARLGQLDVDTLVIDREQRVGDNWRTRYNSLRLHNTHHSNHLPYLEFPKTWQRYLPKDRIANWLEAYVDFMDIALWTRTSFEGASWDEAACSWRAQLTLGDGSKRVLRPKHIIMATSVSGRPKRPVVPTIDKFKGAVIHTSEFKDGAACRGKHVLILGSGTSAHDVAQDLHGNGAHVVMVQRSPTLVVNVEPSAQLYDSVFGETQIPLEDRDLIATSIPKPVMLEAHKQITRKAEALDAELLGGLKKIGFKLSSGIDGTGWPLLFRERGGGYYFNVGCSDLLVRGEVGLLHYADIETFTEHGARMKDGNAVPVDLVVLATGYEGHEDTIKRLFGERVAARVGQIWGFHPDTQELANMWTRTPQQGLWFTGGAFSLCRAYSKYLALQIKAAELGMAD